MGEFKKSYIADRRKLLGMTLAEVSKELGCGLATFARYEHGQSKIPAELLPKLAWVYRCRVADFFSP